MNLDSTTKNIEPFNLFGERSTIWNLKNARDIVKANTYYFYVITAIYCFQYMNQVINSLHTELERGVLLTTIILLLILTLLVQFKMSRVAAVLLLLNFSWNFLDTILGRSSSGMIFMGLMVAVSYRVLMGTIAYKKFKSGQKTANKAN